MVVIVSFRFYGTGKIKSSSLITGCRTQPEIVMGVSIIETFYEEAIPERASEVANSLPARRTTPASGWWVVCYLGRWWPSEKGLQLIPIFQPFVINQFVVVVSILGPNGWMDGMRLEELDGMFQGAP